MGRVEWSRGATDSRLVRTTAYLWIGLTAWLLAGLAAVVALVARRTVAHGDLAVLGVGVVLALVGGWASVAYLAVILDDPAVRSAIREHELASVLRPGGIVGGVLGVGAALAVGSVAGVAGIGAVLVALIAVGAAASVHRTTGAVDPDSGTVEYRTRRSSLDGLAGVGDYRVGDTAFFRLSYARGIGRFDVPRLLVVPASDAEEVGWALSAAVDDDPGDVRTTSTVTRTVVASAGLVLLGAGVSVHLFRPAAELPPSARGYITAVFALLGGVFLVSAAVE